MADQIFKFRGGVWLEYYSCTWPFGALEISQEQLIISDELLKRKVSFKHDEVERIEVKKYFPIWGYGIHIVARDKEISNLLYFWYWSFGFNNLIDALKKFGWLQ